MPRRWPPLVLGAAGAAALTAVALRDPHVPGSWGTCPVLLVTGLPCPGCGGLRAVSDLLAGQPLTALGSNALAVVLVVGGALAWAAWTTAALRRRPLRLVDAVTDRRAVVGVAALAVFTVVRWLPGAGAVLGP
ncbi:DUF2752 domain-containing protein [Pseudokineococcus sp. 5B2Z-1]|uniref:DUF2752 domain-containing protein n=1 Tax=Pseudokineococcus sp. 5B2Z-1 TaxID=3132744 RepID=UPI00309DC60D